MKNSWCSTRHQGKHWGAAGIKLKFRFCNQCTTNAIGSCPAFYIIIRSKNWNPVEHTCHRKSLSVCLILPAWGEEENEHLQEAHTSWQDDAGDLMCFFLLGFWTLGVSVGCRMWLPIQFIPVIWIQVGHLETSGSFFVRHWVIENNLMIKAYWGYTAWYIAGIFNIHEVIFVCSMSAFIADMA